MMHKLYEYIQYILLYKLYIKYLYIQYACKYTVHTIYTYTHYMYIHNMSCLTQLRESRKYQKVRLLIA